MRNLAAARRESETRPPGGGIDVTWRRVKTAGSASILFALHMLVVQAASGADVAVLEDVFLLATDPGARGAMVYVNGSLVGTLDEPPELPGAGRGPRIHLRLSPGRYGFVVRKDGFREYRITVEIVNREPDIGLHVGPYLLNVVLTPK